MGPFANGLAAALQDRRGMRPTSPLHVNIDDVGQISADSQTMLMYATTYMG